MFFIDVGQGDSILIQTPDDRRVLIDGGPGDQALRFIETKYRLDKPANYIDFEAVILTHSDEDHVRGLIPILAHPKIGVKRIYHNGLFPNQFSKSGKRVIGLLDAPQGTLLSATMQELAKAVETAKGQLAGALEGMRRAGYETEMPAGGLLCSRADARQGFIPPFTGGLRLEVLWPEATEEGGPLGYSWYSDEGKTKNGNCVVLRLVHGANSLLLAGDLNVASMMDLLKRRPEKLDARVYKAAHHGSQDFALGFLKAVRPDAAVIMSGDDKNSQYGHPRAVLLGTITRYSKCEMPGVFSTELAACYTPLRDKDLEDFKAGVGQQYAKSIEGVIHLRSDGKKMLIGRVFGRATPDDPLAPTTWKWDVWPPIE